MIDFLKEAESLFDYTQTMRRDFHMHPELGFQEVRTAGIVAKELQSLGLEVSTGVGKTGVVAVIEGRKPGPVLLLRADMDALPIVEETGAAYASQNHGVMHACGHDGHTAILLTVAKMLHKVRNELPGSIKLVFQPAEEGMGGAEGMIRDGVLDNPKVDYVLGLHLWNEKPVGWLGIAAGPYMAGADEFKITLTGKGGHGAAPHTTADPIVAGAHIISALQTIVARNVAPIDTAVVSVTTFHGGHAFNVIPQTAEMTGTIRTFKPEVRDLTLRRFKEVVEGVAQSLGCMADVQLFHTAPAVINNAAVTNIVQQAAAKVLPNHHIDANNMATMGSEDFAFFLNQAPGMFFFVGSANAERGLTYSHHHPKFDVDEAALPQAAALMAQAAVDLLAQ
ncbi:MAG: amidohydrolase [Anaerolineales bacterium]